MGKQKDPFVGGKMPAPPNDKSIEKKLFGKDKTMGDMPDPDRNIGKGKRPF